MLKRVLDPCCIIRVQTWETEAIAPTAVAEVFGVAWPQKTGAATAGHGAGLLRPSDTEDLGDSSRCDRLSFPGLDADDAARIQHSLKHSCGLRWGRRIEARRR